MDDWLYNGRCFLDGFMYFYRERKESMLQGDLGGMENKHPLYALLRLKPLL